jgi:hypothetical protein
MQLETSEFHACKSQFCPYVKVTGENVAKITIGILTIFAIGYVLYKLN